MLVWVDLVALVSLQNVGLAHLVDRAPRHSGCSTCQGEESRGSGLGRNRREWTRESSGARNILGVCRCASDSSQPGNSPNPEGKTCEISQSFMLVDTKARGVNCMGSDLGYKHNGNMCGNPNRLGHRSVTCPA